MFRLGQNDQWGVARAIPVRHDGADGARWSVLTRSVYQEGSIPTLVRVMGLFGDQSKSDRYRELLDALEAGQPPPAGASMEDVAFVERFLSVSRSAVMQEPSDSVRSSLLAHFEAWARDRRPASLLDRISAVLVFDSATAGPMLAGARGATDTAPQRIYAWDGGEVVVRLRSVGGELRLDGQLLPDTDDPAGYTMALVVDGDEVGSVPVDGVGEFAVAGQPGRRASLVARGQELEIEFGPFEVDS